jgi:hypothetical protein
MLKKSASGGLDTLKRRSFPDSDVYASRFTNDEDGLFEHPDVGQLGELPE